MEIITPTISQIFEVLQKLNIKHRLGIAGSFARGTMKSKSDIDVIVDTDCISITDIELIKKTLKLCFGRNSDVICLDLLKQEDIELDNLAVSVGLTVNDCSAYKTICKEVIWCDKVIQ